MRTIKLMLATALAVIFAFNISVAQNYKSQFNITDKGEVKIQDGTTSGTIGPDGIIKNAKGEVVGKISKTDKITNFSDKSGRKMGTVSPDGTLKDTKGKVLYTVSTADESGICKILDSKGKVVGTVHENYKQQGACAIHCLNKK